MSHSRRYHPATCTGQRWRGLAARCTAVLFVTLVVAVVVGIGAAPAHAGTVGIFDTIVNQLGTPDTRGGMVVDEKYVWISAHNSGLWRVQRCTSPPVYLGDVTSDDVGSWDLWWYNSTGNYPANPDAGYYIYEAGKDGNVYIIDTANPSSRKAVLPTGGGVAYGVYATEPAYHTLYVATTGGLKVYDITTPTAPVPATGGDILGGTILPSLDFVSVRGLVTSPAYPYVFATSYTNNTTYIINITTNTVVGTVAYGGTDSLRRGWGYQSIENPAKFYFYTVNSSGDLWITDVSTPSSPALVTYWNSPAGGASNMPGGSVTVQKDYAFVLTSSGNDQGYLYMLDVRDPANPVMVDTLYDAAFGFNDLRMDGCEIHVAAHDGWKMYRMTGWQPDARISNTDTSNYAANDVYETAPSAQIKSQFIEPGQTATYQMYFEHDADRRDRVWLKATPVPAGWTAHYSINGADVTTSILAGMIYPPNGYLLPGEGFTVTLTATPAAGTTSTFQADITSMSWMCMEGNCGPPKDVVRAVAVLGTPHMHLAKDDGKTMLAAGESVAYSIGYSNVGTGIAKDVTVTDVLPAGLTYVSAVPAPTSVSGSGPTTLTWGVGTLAPNAGPFTITVNATVNAGVTEGSTLTNTAKVDYKDTANVSYTQVVATDPDVVVPPRLVKTQTDENGGSPLVDDKIIYTLTPYRGGSDLLDNVRIIDPIPVGAQYESAINAGGINKNYNDVNVVLPAVPGLDEGPPVLNTSLAIAPTTNWVQPGGSITLTMTVKQNSGSTITNVVPTLTSVTGNAYTVTSSPAAKDVPNNTDTTFVWTIRLDGRGEYRFYAMAEDAAGTTTWPEATSMSVLCSYGGPNVVYWNLGSSTAPVPGISTASGRLPYVYALRGANTKEFSKYLPVTHSWISPLLTQPTNGIEKGGALTLDVATGTIYASEGNAKIFYRYDIATNAWTRLADASDNFNEGGAIQYLEVGGAKYVYAVLGGSNRLRRYNVADNTWTVLANTPANVKKGGAITTDGANLYVLQGDRKTGFWRYNIATNTWTTLAVTPGNVGWGGSLARVGNYIYAMRGDGKRDFWRYSISANTWTPMALTPGNVADGGALTTDGAYVYAFQGKTKAFWRYDPETNIWTTLSSVNFTGNVGQGGALVYDPGKDPVGLYTSLIASPALATTGKVATVRIELDSDTAVNNVTPGTLTTTGNGASSTLGTGWTLVSADDDISGPGDSVVYERAGNPTLTAGATPGIVTYTAGATADGGKTFAQGTSNGLIVTPVLSWKIKILAAGIIRNTGLYTGQNYAPAGVLSNEVSLEVRNAASIGDYIWYDMNGDRVQDSGEPGLAGVTVTLKNSVGTVIATAVTSATGSYLFSALAAGTYTVEVNTATLPAGMYQTYDPDATMNNAHTVILGANVNYVTADFGYDAMATLGDYIWYDMDNDGVQDATEPGLPGVTVKLKNAGGTVIATTTTNANGFYSFPGLAVGTYTVEVTPPAGMANTWDLDGNKDNATTAAVTAGQWNLALDFGYRDTGSIGDFVWRDLDCDRVQDGSDNGETGINNITVNLYRDVNGNGVVDAADVLYATAVTGDNPATPGTVEMGWYSFTALPPGAYLVAADGADPYLPAGYDATTANPVAVTLDAGQAYTQADFGFANLGSIGDRVWYDMDGDRVQDPEEPGLAGVQVVLVTPTGNRYVNTASDGTYRFDNLPAGTYTVRVNINTVGAGYAQTFDPDGTRDNQHVVVLGPGVDYVAADFGYDGSGKIGDRVWRDTDHDGVQDDGEAGIPGVRINLYQDINGNGVADAGEPRLAFTDTGSNGAYNFPGLPPGAYVVVADTTDPQLAGLTATSPNPVPVNLAPGQAYLDADFGFGAFARLGDRVWNDLDGDGIQDPGEPGIAGITLTITDNLGNFIAAATTGADGAYLFNALAPGSYIVSLSTPAGYSNTTAVSYAATLVAGQSYLTADFGLRGTSSIGDFVWGDLDGDGLQDGSGNGETGIDGVTVYLYVDANSNGYFDDGEPFVGTTTTGDDPDTPDVTESGWYEFPNLPAGPYLVVIERAAPYIPAGYGATTPRTQMVNLLSNTAYPDADFGFGPFAAVGDTVYYDSNANGVQDTGATDEGGVPNITVNLYLDANNDGIINAGDSLLKSTSTDAYGHYFFGGIAADGSKDYLVQVDTADPQWPAGFTLTTPNPYGYSATAVGPLEDLAAGRTVLSADFGLRGTSTIGDFVWRDLDADGVQDGGTETGVANITLQLWRDTNNNGFLDTGPGGDLLVATTETDANGAYTFTNVNTSAQAYFVTPLKTDPDLPAGYTLTTPDPVKVTISAPTNITTADFGFAGYGSVGDRVWNDLNGNGIQDLGEPGMSGITVRLLDQNGAALRTTTTDAAGIYTFTGLAPGTYKIDVVESLVPAGYYPSPANTTSDDTRDSDSPYGAAVTVSVTGGANTTIDFGFYVPVPTVVVLSNDGLSAVVDRGRVIVTWQTVSETNTAGYYLLRADAKTGALAPVNEELIAAEFNAADGASYAAVDPLARPNKETTYWLQEEEMGGGTNLYGPFTVVAKPGTVKDAELAKQLVGSVSARKEKPAKLTAAPAPFGVRASKPLPKPAPTSRLCIEVTKDGLYRLGATEIATALGMQQTAVKDLIKGNKLALTNEGSPVGILPAADYSALYFYGQAIDSIYTATNVYWLGSGTGTRMANVAARPAHVQPLTTYMETVTAEADVTALTGLFHDPEADFWVWAGWSVTSPGTPVAKTFGIDAPGAIRGVSLDVNLVGVSNKGVENEHHAQIMLNGVLLGEVRWSGSVPQHVTLDIPEGLTLAESANEVTVTGILDSGAPFSQFALDSFSLTYERTTEAVSDHILLHLPTVGPVTVTGLSTTAAWAFDLTDPRLPKLAPVTTSGTDAGTSWITFQMGGSGPDYLVSTAAGALSPQAMTATPPGTLRKAGRGADYVVITTPALKATAQRLADYRSAQGLSVAVVTTYEIYDEFSYGIATPHAFTAFIDYALASWSPAPRFVVLAGEGGYDYKNNLAKGDSLVPPLMVDTDWGLAPSDVRLADVNADAVADVALGRIPAITETQLADYVAKVIAYEAAGSGDWRRTALVVADNPDAGGDFANDSERLAALLPADFQIPKAYLSPVLTAAAARTLLLSTLSSGALFVNYVGHAGQDALAGERLLTSADADTLANGPRLPVMSMLTCVAGQYGRPGFDSLSEKLVKRAGGGAIAVWAPSAEEENSESVLLGGYLIQNVFKPPSAASYGTGRGDTLGENVRAASAAYVQGGGRASVVQTYNLLGDPALRLSW